MDEVFTEPEQVDTSALPCNMTLRANCSEKERQLRELYSSRPEAFIVPCIFACILITGVVGNALLILSFVRHKSLNTPHNALVVNLASGDFIFLILSLPFNSLWYTIPDWHFGLIMCKVSHFAENLATAVVIATLSILSIERCLIVTGTRLWRQQKSGPLLLTLMIWVGASMVSLPNLFSAGLVTRVICNKTYKSCEIYQETLFMDYPKAHVALTFILLFAIPLIIIGTAYTIIAVHLLLRPFPLSQSSANRNKPKKIFRLGCNAGNESPQVKKRWKQSLDTEQTFASKSSYKPVPEKNITVKKDSEEQMAMKTGASPSKNKEIEQSNAAPAVDDDKSASPDSCTEMTELQQTPVLPFSFVYTGPIPAGAYPQQVPRRRSKDVPAAAAKDENSTHATKVGTEATIPEHGQKLETGVSSSHTVDKGGSIVEDNGTTTWKETTPLNSNQRSEAKRGCTQRKQTMQTKRRRLAFTVLMLVVAFVICWTPRHIYKIWFFLAPGFYDGFWHVFKILGFCLSFSYSAVNPIVFYVLDNTYRSFVNSALCTICLKRCRSQKNKGGETAMIIAERDYNATIAMTDMKSKGNVTEL